LCYDYLGSFLATSVALIFSNFSVTELRKE